MTKALAVLVFMQLLLAAANAFCSISSRPLCESQHWGSVEGVSIRPRGRVRRTTRQHFPPRQRTQQSRVFTTENDDSNGSTSSSSYESSASVTKGLVSSLTSLTNNIIGGKSKNERISDASTTTTSSSCTPPTSPEELLTRIEKEYTDNNYLWTGNIGEYIYSNHFFSSTKSHLTLSFSQNIRYILICTQLYIY